MFTIENTPRIGQAIIYNERLATVKSLQGVIADATYGSKSAFVGIEYEDGSRDTCSLYEIRPCGFHD